MNMPKMDNLGVGKLVSGFGFVFLVDVCLRPFSFPKKETSILPHLPPVKQLEMAVYTWDGAGGDKQCLRTNYRNDRNGYKTHA